VSTLLAWLLDLRRADAKDFASGPARARVSAIARLAELQHAIEEHGHCVDDHSIDFGRIEQAVASHECLMDGEAGEPLVPPDEAVIRRHREQEAAFCRQENAHGRIAHHHDSVMECMRALEAAAAAAM